MNFLRTLTSALAILATAVSLGSLAQAADSPHAAPWPSLLPAARLPNATTAPLLAAAHAGRRVVAVGDHGVILLSDDGRSFRQAQAVPVRTLLTTVQFVDAQHGYAAGHDGVLLETRDGGETWALLRTAPGREQAILALHFDSAEHGIAVGPYGWAIETRDGGRHWTELQIESGANTDRHLLHLFGSGRGSLLATAEGGEVYRSADGGRRWQTVSTGGRASLWHGLALADGSLLVCGMRGHLYRSQDDGLSWVAVDTHTTQSLTGIAQRQDGSVLVVGMGGTVLTSRDGGRSFTASTRPGQEPLTAVLIDGAEPLLLSMAGPLPRAAPSKP